MSEMILNDEQYKGYFKDLFDAVETVVTARQKLYIHIMSGGALPDGVTSERVYEALLKTELLIVKAASVDFKGIVDAATEPEYDEGSGTPAEHPYDGSYSDTLSYLMPDGSIRETTRIVHPEKKGTS